MHSSVRANSSDDTESKDRYCSCTLFFAKISKFILHRFSGLLSLYRYLNSLSVDCVDCIIQQKTQQKTPANLNRSLSLSYPVNSFHPVKYQINTLTNKKDNTNNNKLFCSFPITSEKSISISGDLTFTANNLSSETLIDYSIDQHLLRHLLFKLLYHFHLDDFSIDLSFVSAKKIAKLNHQYKNKNQPTDILSFAQNQFANVITHKNKVTLVKDGFSHHQHLGDLVICLNQLAKKSIDWQYSYSKYLIHLTVHGILHLGGHDHFNENDAKLMKYEEQLAMNMILLDQHLQSINILSIIKKE